jgi:hypothetical protein
VFELSSVFTVLTVTISGTAQESAVLTATPTLALSSGSVADVTYQWMRDGSPIDGATGSTYQLTEADEGAQVTVQASFTDGGTGQTATAISNPSGIVLDAPPNPLAEIILVEQAGQPLTLSAELPGLPADNTAAFQWLKSSDGGLTFQPIAGATGGTYAEQPAEVGDLFEVTTTVTNENGVTASATSGAVASKVPAFTSLASFSGGDGSEPVGGLVMDAAGDLFGATDSGGAFGHGAIFEIARTGGSYASTPTTLASFSGPDGGEPDGGLILDAAGNLLGTTFSGGAFGQGTVFELAKTGGGYAGTPTSLVSFRFPGAFNPVAGLVADAAAICSAPQSVPGVSSRSPRPAAATPAQRRPWSTSAAKDRRTVPC